MIEQPKACPLCHEQGHLIGGVKDRMAHPYSNCGLSGQQFSLRVWHLFTRAAPEADAPLREALLKRDAEAGKCPIQKRFQVVCSRCGATPRETCGKIAYANATFVEAVRAALANTPAQEAK